jgi:hypothetical protein
MKKEMRDLTSQPVNHVAYIGRSSGKAVIRHDSYKKLELFAKTWK